MNRKITLPVLFTVLLALDQISKLVVQANLRMYEKMEIIPKFFNITYVLNPGAAFGIFQNQSETFRQVFFLTITVAACILIIYLIFKEYRFRLRTYAYTAVVAGAVGNMIDRIRIGRVVDFLDFYYKNFHWYTFNIADCAITVGIALLLLDMFVVNRHASKTDS